MTAVGGVPNSTKRRKASVMSGRWTEQSTTPCGVFRGSRIASAFFSQKGIGNGRLIATNRGSADCVNLVTIARRVYLLRREVKASRRLNNWPCRKQIRYDTAYQRRAGKMNAIVRA